MRAASGGRHLAQSEAAGRRDEGDGHVVAVKRAVCAGARGGLQPVFLGEDANAVGNGD